MTDLELIIAIGGFLAGFLFLKGWEWAMKSHDKKEELKELHYSETREIIKESTRAINSLTLEVHGLKHELRRLDEIAKEIPGMLKDINGIGEKLRRVAEKAGV